MNTGAAYQAESMVRLVAKWGSLAAAMIFAVGWATDGGNYPGVDVELVFFTAAIVTVFLGYALAWFTWGELSGSLLALLATAIAYCVTSVGAQPWPHPMMLMIAVPALLHLAAVELHWSRQRHLHDTAPRWLRS